MRPNLPFHSATSNAILKPGGPLKWKMQLVKDARLSLPLTEAIEIARLTSPLPDMPRQSSPRLKHGRRLALLLPKSIYSLLRSVAGSSSNFPNCCSPKESASVYADYLRFHFSVSQPKVLRSRARGYHFELHRAKCPEESHSFFCSPFSPTEFLAAASKPLLVHCHWPRQSCLSHAKAPSSLWHGFTSSHFQSLLDCAFLSFHLEGIFYYSHR